MWGREDYLREIRHATIVNFYEQVHSSEDARTAAQILSGVPLDDLPPLPGHSSLRLWATTSPSDLCASLVKVFHTRFMGLTPRIALGEFLRVEMSPTYLSAALDNDVPWRAAAEGWVTKVPVDYLISSEARAGQFQ